VLVAPVLFFLWKAAVTVFRSTGRWLRSSREALVARATKRKAERAAREAAKAAARTADTQPSKEKK